MDGYAATQALRAQPSTAGLPVIAVTANALPSERERCLQAGMNDYVPKPIDPDRLRAVLEKWVQPRCAAHPDSLPMRLARILTETTSRRLSPPLPRGERPARLARRVRGCPRSCRAWTPGWRCGG